MIMSEQIKPEIKIRIYKILMDSIMTYVAEVWDSTEQRLLTAELAFWRRCCITTLLDTVGNGVTHVKMNSQTTMIDNIELRSLRRYFHVNRMVYNTWPKHLIQ